MGAAGVQVDQQFRVAARVEPVEAEFAGRMGERLIRAVGVPFSGTGALSTTVPARLIEIITSAAVISPYRSFCSFQLRVALVPASEAVCCLNTLGLPT